jgi:hypothetical protein
VPDISIGSKVIVSKSGLGSTIIWQNAPRGETGGKLIGDIPETILPLVIARLEALIAPPNTYSRDTDDALAFLRKAQRLLEARRADRETRGVSGTYVP